MESFAPNHARGPAFILEHGDPDGIDLAHSVWPSAAPDRRVDRFDHSSAGDRACSSRSFHARPARSNSDLAKVDAPSCWAPAIDCRQHGSELNGPGDWRVEKHGTTKRRSWHKLHIGLDAVSGEIVASTLTGRDIDDGSHVATLLDQVDGSVGVFLGDGAYDSADVYAAVEERHPDALVIVPPRAGAVASSQTSPTQRDGHIRNIAARGRRGWQAASGYNRRALVEAQIGRYKRVIGNALRSHTEESRRAEVAIANHVLNRMNDLGRPKSVRVS